MATKVNKIKNIKDICYRYKLLIKTLDRLERGLWTAVDIHWCSDTITWLWKWRKITEEEMNVLCNRVIAILNV